MGVLNGETAHLSAFSCSTGLDTKETWKRKCNLRNYFYIDMDPPHPMSFWHLLARLDMDIYPQNKCDVFPV